MDFRKYQGPSFPGRPQMGPQAQAAPAPQMGGRGMPMMPGAGPGQAGPMLRRRRFPLAFGQNSQGGGGGGVTGKGAISGGSISGGAVSDMSSGTLNENSSPLEMALMA